MPLTATDPSPPPRSRCINPRRSELYDPEAGERFEHRAVGSFRPSGKIYRYRAADAGEGATALSAARDLEKQAQQLSAGWERELAIALDASFPFSALLPLIAEFYAQNPQTRLNFSHHTLAGSWEELTHHGRILSSAPSMSRPPPRSGHGKPSARWITSSSSPPITRWLRRRSHWPINSSASIGPS